MESRNRKYGFTLIEVLLVIAIIAILAAIVLIALNPPRNIAMSNNTQRWSNINAILSGIHQYAIDHAGQLPSAITTVPTEVCKTDANCAGLVDLGVLTFEERYIMKLPYDPTSASTNGTGYYVSKDSYNRVTVAAPFAQLGETISVSR